MKLSLLFLLPVTTMAFAPIHHQTRSSAIFRPPSLLVRKMDVDSVAETVTSTTEEYVGKADNLVLSRAMRVIDHAPLLFTLKALTDKAGISISASGVTSNPEVFSGLATALSVPTWCFNIWTIIALAQLASAAKSILASDGNELSQASITATTAANFAATRAIGSVAPLRDTILLALVSGFSLRKGDSSGGITLSNAGVQLMASFTSVLAVLGVISKVAPKIPIIGSNPATTSLLGVFAMYAMATRAGNGTSKKAVNAGILSGMVVAAVSGGLSISASIPSILSNIGLAGTAYIAYLSLNSLKKAIA